ncbi:MAG: alcohol dehydrogenase catalytic domain-containing protein [Pseudomonadota bacterium]
MRNCVSGSAASGRLTDRSIMKRSISLVNSWNTISLVHSNLERVRPADGNVLVEIYAATICEADRRFVTGSKRVESNSRCTTLGHEAVGRVVAKGRNVQLRVGQMVAIMPHQVGEDERRKKAFQRGEIFKLHTCHAGMGADGTLANHIEWPAEWVRPLSAGVVARAKKASLTHGLHWTAPLAEIEHLACVMTSVDHFVKAEGDWANNRNLEALESGEGKALLVGSGWMGYLNVLHWTERFPNMSWSIKDPDEGRLRDFRELSQKAIGRRPTVVNGLDESAAAEFDVVIMTTAARPAAKDLFHFLKPGAHVVLFSGIHNGSVDLIFDPAKLADLERVHRDGLAALMFRTSEAEKQDMVVASGTSGYTVSAFERAVEQMPDYAVNVAAGITGVVLGMESNELVALGPGVRAVRDPDGAPVLRTLFLPHWPGRESHWKIAVHPSPTMEIKEAYNDFISAQKGGVS